MSAGKCVAIHLPVKSYSTEATAAEFYSTAEDEDNNDELLIVGTHEEEEGQYSIEKAYQREYCLSKETQQELYLREKNVMRNQKEGKASLDR